MTEQRSGGSSSSRRGARIRVTRNGPYVVTGAVPMSEQAIVIDANGDSRTWKTGKEYPAQETAALCRCGRSANMPFCDGSHTRVRFDGSETASREPYLDQAGETDGPTLRLTDAESFCASARFCDRAGGTWRLTQESADPEARRIAIEEAGDCPSGRLVVWGNDGVPIEPRFEPSIGLVKDPQAPSVGPIWVRGGIPIESADGEEYEVRNRVTLCRCGRSGNKPFCDGSHMDE
jgi:CDGSH-type Zn-finger protein